jgi:hypothetical protein
MVSNVLHQNFNIQDTSRIKPWRMQVQAKTYPLNLRIRQKGSCTVMSTLQQGKPLRMA